MAKNDVFKKLKKLVNDALPTAFAVAGTFALNNMMNLDYTILALIFGGAHILMK